MTQIALVATPKYVATTLSQLGAPIAAPSQRATVVRFPVPHHDVGLVKSLLSGQPGSVQALGERHGEGLTRIAMRVLGPDPAICAVVHEAVTRSLERLNELDQPSKLYTWLMGHLICVVQRRLRVRRLSRWVSFLFRWWPESDRHRMNDSASERLVLTYRLLERLNDRERIVFCLVTFDGMYPAEVATITGTSVENVRRRLERAQRRVTQLSASMLGQYQ